MASKAIVPLGHVGSNPTPGTRTVRGIGQTDNVALGAARCAMATLFVLCRANVATEREAAVRVTLFVRDFASAPHAAR